MFFLQFTFHLNIWIVSSGSLLLLLPSVPLRNTKHCSAQAYMRAHTHPYVNPSGVKPPATPPVHHQAGLWRGARLWGERGRAAGRAAEPQHQGEQLYP